MKLYELAFIASLAAIFPTTSAWAYLDPGTGSILLQGIIGGIAAGAVMIKMYWRKLVELVSRKTAPRDPDIGSDPSN